MPLVCHYYVTTRGDAPNPSHHYPPAGSSTCHSPNPSIKVSPLTLDTRAQESQEYPHTPNLNVDGSVGRAGFETCASTRKSRSTLRLGARGDYALSVTMRAGALRSVCMIDTRVRE